MALAPSLRAPPKPGALRPLPCPKPSSTNIINMPHSQPLAQSSVLHVPAAARCSATFRQRCAVRTRVAEAPVPSTQTTSSTWSAPAGIDLAAYPSMSGRHVLITGAGRGIGMCSARLLAYLGATVHIADINPTDEALARIRQDVPWADVRATPRLDLGSQASTKKFAQWVADSGLPISILINNAGANFMGVEPWYTDQGVAGLAQVNFLGPYTLTRLLQDVLLASSPQPRVVNVASVMHRFTSLPSDPQSFLTDWWKGGSYRACKHALVGFTALLQRELGPAGMVAVSVDPGAVYSGIWANSRILGKPPGSTVIRALFSSTEDACATTLHAAAAPDVQPGAYYARGLFASSLLTEMPYEPWAGLLSVLDAPLRTASGGRLCAELAAAPIAPRARDLAPFKALWDACADLAELPRETRLSPELLAARRARGWQAPGTAEAAPAMATVTADQRR